MKEFEFPGSYHVVEFIDNATGLFIDDGTRKEIETALNAEIGKSSVFITVDDVYGVEFFIRLSRILMIHNTTPETRLTYRLHNQAIDQERAKMGPFDPDN